MKKLRVGLLFGGRSGEHEVSLLSAASVFNAIDKGKYEVVLILNEINTMPGFTSISMYPKLWEASGVTYSDLIDQLIQLGIDRHKDKRRNQYSQ